MRELVHDFKGLISSILLDNIHVNAQKAFLISINNPGEHNSMQLGGTGGVMVLLFIGIESLHHTEVCVFGTEIFRRLLGGHGE